MATQTAPPTLALPTSLMTGSTCENDKKIQNHQRLTGRVRKSPSNYDANENCLRTYDHFEKCENIEFILSKLSPDELEILAQSSYRYLKNPILTQRNIYAARVVHRCLESKKGNVASTLTKVEKLLEFRRNTKVDQLITAFDGDCMKNFGDTAEMLQKQLVSKKFYVQGFDKEGRSTLYFIPRNVVDHDLDSAIYSIERAIACSRSLDKTINCVVDFSKFPLTNAPPLEVGKQFLTTLRLIYSGQINRIFLMNVPFSFTILWNVFSPFVGTDTRDKIAIIKDNSKEKEKEMLQLYDVKELPRWAVPGGEKNRSIDLDEYLFEMPFDSAFDDSTTTIQ